MYKDVSHRGIMHSEGATTLYVAFILLLHGTLNLGVRIAS